MVLFIATITLKNIPPILHRALKERAEHSRRSLNSEILSTLEKTLEIRERNVGLLLLEAEQFRKSIKFKISSKDIDLAKRKGRA